MILLAVTVKDVDLGFKKRVRNLQRINNKSVKAGVFEGSGSEDNGTSLVDVAFYNEYGTSKIPARPFVRIASEKNQQTWANEAERVVDKVVAGYDANFSILGNTMKENIQDVIGDKNLLVPNSPATIRRKGHDKPLIDTGKLKASIDFGVE